MIPLICTSNLTSSLTAFQVKEAQILVLVGCHDDLEIRVSLHFINLLERVVHIAIYLKCELPFIAPRPVKHTYHRSYVRYEKCIGMMRHP